MIIFLHGPDTYRSSQKLNEFVKKFQEKRDKIGLSVIKLDGEDLTTDSFRKNTLSAGLFTNKRLIVIKNLLSENKDKNLLEEILSFLKRPSQENNVVIFYESESPLKNDLNQKIFNLLKKEKFAEEFNLLEGRQLENWILAEVKKRKGQISKEALGFLSEAFANNLWQISNEINKALAYGEGKIKKEDLEIISEIKEEENIFNLIDALIDKNKKRAVELLKNELENGVSPVQLVGSLAYQFRVMLRIHGSEDLNHYQLAKDFGVHPFVVKKASWQAKKYDLEKLKKIFQEILKIDIQLKTSVKNPELLFDLLIARM